MRSIDERSILVSRKEAQKENPDERRMRHGDSPEEGEDSSLADGRAVNLYAPFVPCCGDLKWAI